MNEPKVQVIMEKSEYDRIITRFKREELTYKDAARFAVNNLAKVISEIGRKEKGKNNKFSSNMRQLSEYLERRKDQIAEQTLVDYELYAYCGIDQP